MVPEQQSHEAERALCQMGGTGPLSGLRSCPLADYAAVSFRPLAAWGSGSLDGGGRLLLMYRALKETSEVLTVYARASQRPAFLTALLATVDELKSCCIPPEALITAGQEAGGPEGNKLRDLGLICGTYDALTANVALDPRDRDQSG